VRNRWLLKTEPAEFAFEDLVREGRSVWDGVTNPLALKHLRAIRKGDELLIYHTGNVRAIVGLAKAVSDPYPDPAKNDPKRAVVDVVPVRELPRPIRLVIIKSQRAFRSFELVRISRLSVMPVPSTIWRTILRLAGE
jgi:predicted RNA-binding protein with PUA-like domain